MDVPESTEDLQPVDGSLSRTLDIDGQVEAQRVMVGESTLVRCDVSQQPQGGVPVAQGDVKCETSEDHVDVPVSPVDLQQAHNTPDSTLGVWHR